MVGNYKVITLCGSTRFKYEFLEAQKRLTLEGNIVVSVGLFGHAGDAEVWDNMDEGTLSKTKQMLDDMHKRKIDMADEIYVINVDGYIGDSTRSEIEYAMAHGKGVRYLVEPGTKPVHYLFTIRDYLHAHHVEYDVNAVVSVQQRQAGKKFTLQEHVKAMVYSLLTNQTVWNRVVPCLSTIDKTFHDYDPAYIKRHGPNEFAEKLFALKCGNRSTQKQMKALKGNIEVLELIEADYGSVDDYVTGTDIQQVVKSLSKSGSNYKLSMMGEPLVWEYLRNVGIDGVKPDTHIRRFLGGERMGEPGVPALASINDVFRQVEKLAKETGLLKAEIDNLIWSFCAEDYGEICTAKPRCELCPIRSKCHMK